VPPLPGCQRILSPLGPLPDITSLYRTVSVPVRGAPCATVLWDTHSTDTVQYCTVSVCGFPLLTVNSPAYCKPLFFVHEGVFCTCTVLRECTLCSTVLSRVLYCLCFLQVRGALEGDRCFQGLGDEGEMEQLSDEKGEAEREREKESAGRREREEREEMERRRDKGGGIGSGRGGSTQRR